MADTTQAIAARFGSRTHKTKSRTLTVDNTARKITLTAGGWRLYGIATQCYYATRFVTSAAGTTLADGEDSEPDANFLAASSAGSPTAGFAWGTGTPGDGASSVGRALVLPTDPTDWREITVPPGMFLNLYIKCGTTAAPRLEGPFE